MSKEDIDENIRIDNNFKIVSVARLSYAKGIDNAVKALKILHDRGLSDIKWYVVGYGGEEGMIRKLIEENNLEDKVTVNRARRVRNFLSQPFSVAEQFSGLEGKYVPVSETIRSFKEILAGKYDDLPEQAFMMVGTVEEAVEKAKGLAND